jgi:hypothetical protein
MCRNVRSIDWHQKTYHEISWDYPFKCREGGYELIVLIFRFIASAASILEEYNSEDVSIGKKKYELLKGAFSRKRFEIITLNDSLP